MVEKEMDQLHPKIRAYQVGSDLRVHRLQDFAACTTPFGLSNPSRPGSTSHRINRQDLS
jgi:hypothetical protein